MTQPLNRIDPLSPLQRRGLQALAAAGLIALVAGVATHAAGVWPGFLVAFYLFVGLGLGSMVFVAIHYASSARWGVQFRRVPEAMAAVLYVSALGLPLLLWAVPQIYPWTDPAYMAAHPILALKAGWLTQKAFSLRSLVCMAGWLLLAAPVLAHSRKQDVDGKASHTGAAARWSMGFLIFFGYSFALASTDWLGSLEPLWHSTIFGVYSFAAIFQSAIAAITLLVLLLEKAGVYEGQIREEHLHDLGKFLFAFSCFWAYMWFSQFMLTWYSDQPSENAYYILRMSTPGWAWTLGLIVTGRFFVPFFGLASQKVKRDRKILAAVCALVLLSHWADAFLMATPPLTPGGLHFGLYDLLLPLGGVAAFLLLFFSAFSRRPPVPLRDPGLDQSRHYRS